MVQGVIFVANPCKCVCHALSENTKRVQTPAFRELIGEKEAIVCIPSYERFCYGSTVHDSIIVYCWNFGAYGVCFGCADGFCIEAKGASGAVVRFAITCALKRGEREGGGSWSVPYMFL